MSKLNDSLQEHKIQETLFLNLLLEMQFMFNYQMKLLDTNMLIVN